MTLYVYVYAYIGIQDIWILISHMLVTYSSCRFELLEIMAVLERSVKIYRFTSRTLVSTFYQHLIERSSLYLCIRTIRYLQRNDCISPMQIADPRCAFTSRSTSITNGKLIWISFVQKNRLHGSAHASPWYNFRIVTKSIIKRSGIRGQEHTTLGATG